MSDDETIWMECPECGLTGAVPAFWEGKTAECKGCKKRFTVKPRGETDE